MIIISIIRVGFFVYIWPIYVLKRFINDMLIKVDCFDNLVEKNNKSNRVLLTTTVHKNQLL